MRRFASLAAAALLAAACASLPTDYPREPSSALTDTAGTTLGRLSARFAHGGAGGSGVHLLPNGVDAFAARLVLAATAERSLDVQYYIWHRDTTGQLLAHALLQAADRGVRVRVLLDDIGTAPEDDNLLALDAHPGIQVRLFNPLARRGARNLAMLGSFERTNRRMHNKSFTADNQATLVGGRNVGDEYYGASHDVAFGDLDVIAVGTVVPQVSASFDRYWNSASTFPIEAFGGRPDPARLAQVRLALDAFAASQSGGPYAQAMRTGTLLTDIRAGAVAFTPATVRVVADDPAKIEQPEAAESAYLLPQMRPEFESMRRELLLVSPYFVPGEGGVAKLKALRDRGLRVRIVTNSLAATDVPAVHAGYARYREALLDAGIELYEVKATARPQGAGGSGTGLTGSSRASLHAKTMFFDCERFFVGSMNVDPRSVFTNTEIGVMVEAPALARRACDALGERLPVATWRVGRDASGRLTWTTREDGSELRADREPSGSAWRGFQAWFFSLLPIEPLL
jgi:putative cardiolipin synthase